MARCVTVRPDVLVADLGLPGEDGYALLSRFRAIYPDVPAIALTAYARSTDRDRVLAHGFQHHVVKPVDPKDLIDLVGSVAGLRPKRRRRDDAIDRSVPSQAFVGWRFPRVVHVHVQRRPKRAERLLEKRPHVTHVQPIDGGVER